MSLQVQPSLIIEYLQANKGKHFESYAIAKAIGTGPSNCQDMLRKLVDLKMVQKTKEGKKQVYFIRDGELPETRTFVQKPHKFDQAMIDLMNQIKADRVTLPSKTNTDDAGELSEMDRTKLRMMGSGN